MKSLLVGMAAGAQAVLLALVVSVCAGCSTFSLGDTFKKVDDHCIEGKLTEVGAQVLNETEGAVDWHKDYVEHYGGAATRDRILSAHCSEPVKDVTGSIADAVDGKGEKD